ncbi:MAG: SMI1/KNR4 family protein [Cyclobacteriaceae bacterium]
MNFEGTIHTIDQITDQETFEILPKELQELYRDIPGAIAYGGGFTLRGCVTTPEWISLRDAWQGEHAFHTIYEAVLPADIPFGSDCMGDQFIYREGTVWYLITETGELEDSELSLDEFISLLLEDPDEMLSLEPLQFFMENGNELEPGQLLNVFPPFSFELNEGESYQFKAVPYNDQLAFTEHIYLQSQDMSRDGEITLMNI